MALECCTVDEASDLLTHTARLFDVPLAALCEALVALASREVRSDATVTLRAAAQWVQAEANSPSPNE